MGQGRDHDELRDRIALIATPGIGPAQFFTLIEEYGSAARALRSPAAARRLREHTRLSGGRPDQARVAAVLRWADAPSHAILCFDDPDYPPLLQQIARPPPVLFVAGDAGLLGMPQVAMVGSRNATRGGCGRAQLLARGLCERGFAITSGLARGIDAAAHRGALDAGGRTIAVFGCGLDTVYPARHAELARQIVDGGGACVSEFLPDVMPAAENFPRRNRVISGLSLGTLVVQAQRRSGSLITARCALEQGRDVFAVPGDIDDPLAFGCNRLIKDGAKLVQDVYDVLDEFGQYFRDVCKPAVGTAAVVGGTTAGSVEDAFPLLRWMESKPMSTDELIELSGLTPQDVSSILFCMELEGLIESRPGGLFVRTGPRPAQ